MARAPPAQSQRPPGGNPQIWWDIQALAHQVGFREVAEAEVAELLQSRGSDWSKRSWRSRSRLLRRRARPAPPPPPAHG